MTVRPIVITGEPVLHQRAQPVESFDDELRALVEDMFETMDAAHGVGLAAPQIGVGLRIFTWQMENSDGAPERGVIVNPYVSPSKPAQEDPDPHDEVEGCLSVPGESFPLKRGEKAGVTGYDVDGNEISFEATGWFARCMQHEYDHLNGFLYVDRLNDKWGRKAKKAVKRNGWGKPGHTWMPGVDPDPFGHDTPDEHDL
jgi:peptide deformylase